VGKRKGGKLIVSFGAAVKNHMFLDFLYPLVWRGKKRGGVRPREKRLGEERQKSFVYLMDIVTS